jgi:hypothetical protein
MPPIYKPPPKSLHKKLIHLAKHPRAKGVLLAVLVALYVLHEVGLFQVGGRRGGREGGRSLWCEFVVPCVLLKP